MLPYLGDKEDESWNLTYPAFQIAASKKAEETPEGEQLILDIMEAMVDQDGQTHISYGKNMIPYNKGVELELLPELENLKPYIDENKMYIRLASNEMFSISHDIVHKILADEIKTPEAAFNAFNEKMKEGTPAGKVVAHIDRGYSNEFTRSHGNQAASAVCNTIRKEAGADLMFAQGCYFGSIYEGDYTEAEIGYICGGGPVLTDMTGEQIYKLVESALALEENRGAVCNDSALYVSSGFEMDITKSHGEYTLNALTIDGEELDKEKTYSILVYADIDWVVTVLIEAVGCSDYNREMPKCSEYIYKRLAEDGRQFEEPTDYITIR